MVRKIAVLSVKHSVKYSSASMNGEITNSVHMNLEPITIVQMEEPKYSAARSGLSMTKIFVIFFFIKNSRRMDNPEWGYCRTLVVVLDFFSDFRLQQWFLSLNRRLGKFYYLKRFIHMKITNFSTHDKFWRWTPNIGEIIFHFRGKAL